MNAAAKFKFFARDMVFPGLDLHTRNRACLCRYWKTGARDVLDAGSGNGYFSWLAYQSGATVLALNFEANQVEKARAYFLKHRKADPARLSFEERNLYDLDNESRRFDEIICYETLEHITRDSNVVAQFYRLLRPGGILHLCCPNRLHPRHQREQLDLSEKGGHVRAGYSEIEYRHLLEPIGFHLDTFVGIGPRSLYFADKILRAIRNRFGDIVALPLLPIGLLAVKWARLNPPQPFSIYVRAIRDTSSLASNVLPWRH
jgi:SAM-dependent methyltransferase